MRTCLVPISRLCQVKSPASALTPFKSVIQTKLAYETNSVRRQEGKQAARSGVAEKNETCGRVAGGGLVQQTNRFDACLLNLLPRRPATVHRTAILIN